MVLDGDWGEGGINLLTLLLGGTQLLFQPSVNVPIARVLLEPLFDSLFYRSAEISFLSAKHCNDCEPELSFCFITENYVHSTHDQSPRVELFSL